MANFFTKFIDSFRSDNDEDDGYLDDDFFEEEDDYAVSEKAPKKSPVKIGGLFNKNKVISTNSEIGVMTMRPAKVDDAKEIANHLLDGSAVIINIEGVSGDVAQRIIDFTLGTVYAIEGDLQQISKFIFIASPPNVELGGEYQGDMTGNAENTLNKQVNNVGFRFNS